jgi:hypothetical protein
MMIIREGLRRGNERYSVLAMVQGRAGRGVKRTKCSVQRGAKVTKDKL